MKYDFELDMNSKNALSIIINSIKPNSTILEFGPAMGRMTKYLKDNLNCKVYIVEIDEEGYNSAIRYSEDGVLGNIEDYEWVNKFSEIQFDFIIFADVLEHLIDPKTTIKYSKKLLKEDGRLLFSMPNIAHNSVLIDLFNNEFKYRELGILDNTHLRFFTYNSLNRLIQECGFVTEKQEAVYVDVGKTEFSNSYASVSKSLKQILKKKKFGNVYQFVFTCVKEDYYKENKDNITIAKNIKPIIQADTFKIYIDTNSGYSEDLIVSTKIRPGLNTLHFNLEQFELIKNIRIDFVEESCMLRVHEIIINGEAVNVELLKGNYTYKINNNYLFLYDDPQIFINNLNKTIYNIDVKFEYENLSIQPMTNEFFNLIKSKIQNTGNELKVLQNNNKNSQETIKDLKERNKKLQEKIKDKEEVNRNLQETINSAKEKNKQLQELIKDREETNKKLQEKIKDKEEVNRNLQKKIKDVENRNKQLQESIKNIEKINKELQEKNGVLEEELRLVKDELKLYTTSSVFKICKLINSILKEK